MGTKPKTPQKLTNENEAMREEIKRIQVDMRKILKLIRCKCAACEQAKEIGERNFRASKGMTAC
jgi:hypothetical protein